MSSSVSVGVSVRTERGLGLRLRPGLEVVSVGEGLSSYFGLMVDIGVAIEQKLCAVAMALLACHNKRRRTVLGARGLHRPWVTVSLGVNVSMRVSVSVGVSVRVKVPVRSGRGQG